ncbi:MAG: GNAT family N-acetyltransferase [Actinomycetota bacterium]
MCGPVAKRAETLQHGIDVASVAAAAAHRGRIRNELGIGSDELVVGTVANFRPQKDYPNLLQAARLLADRDVPVRLVAVGQGPQESETCELRNELGLQERVILTGFRNDATSVMGACDVFTLASRWEGLPVALMEALALGLPVVATDVGGVGEELVDGKTALLVPPSDAASLAHAIERVVTAPELREALARAASERAVDFDVVSAVARIEAAYAALAPEAAATSPEPVIPRRRRPLPKGLDIRDATPDDRPAILELCRASLGWGDDSRFDELFSWKHDQNAFGPSYMWVATDGGKVVGLRAFMRWEFVRDDEVLRAVRAVDTATHPDYQGRGLFTAMTLHGLDVVKDDGVAFVFNTPNDKSRPGYLKMGWKEVGRLPVGIRLASPMAAWTVVRSRTGASHWPEPLHLGDPVAEKLDGDLGGPTGRTGVRSVCTNRTTEFVRWRYGSAVLGYRAIPYSGDGVAIVRCRRRGQSRELVLLDSFGERPPSPRSIDDWLQSSRATHALRLGRYGSTAGFAPYPAGGPLLTWREANSMAPPPAINWALVMGDVELF